MIQVLDQHTIDKIAAGEVVERPASVVKELVENAIDSGANAITIEIKEGGISFIRITDNGCGIPADEVETAFLRHATSKITSIEDLLTASSLGFRGEALSSIAAVAQVELITKTGDSLTGIRYEIHGGVEQTREEIGCPEGTTFIVRNLFYNTPARRKFLKTAMTEGGYINELVEQIAMSRPDISFKFVNNGQNKLNTSGNGNIRDIIYHIYGRDISGNLLPIDAKREEMRISGFVAKPYVSRGNRSFEHYFVNGRYIKSPIITKAIEEAYKTFVMIHKFPFVVLNLEVDSKLLDVNVHPRKMEMRYSRGEELYKFIFEEIRGVLLQKELIPEVSKAPIKGSQNQSKTMASGPEPFEVKRKAQMQEKILVNPPVSDSSSQSHGSENERIASFVREESGFQEKSRFQTENKNDNNNVMSTNERIKVSSQQPSENLQLSPDNRQWMSDAPDDDSPNDKQLTDISDMPEQVQSPSTPKGEQMSWFASGFLSEEARPKHRLIGQLFRTYWLIEYENNLFIMDQHAAHEKVMYETLMKQYQNRKVLSQQIDPPLVISVNPRQLEVLQEHQQFFADMGFQMESFGGKEYMLRSVPLETYGLAAQDIFIDFIDSLMEEGNQLNMDLFIYKIATMACKAAVKGNMTLSTQEADALIDQLLQLENPYNCPHGRPTIIAMTETELEKKFKRIQDR
ncbi:MAG: DNA mismatch repair endonuclease MutL [Bacteroides sp.]|nr:DNA mismatch repair endonuclease MutL [Bacteroides sp.]MCM1549363.1 DNA mismatch repair endonuclease MutL [Clostridium sp.]